MSRRRRVAQRVKTSPRTGASPRATAGQSLVVEVAVEVAVADTKDGAVTVGVTVAGADVEVAVSVTVKSGHETAITVAVTVAVTDVEVAVSVTLHSGQNTTITVAVTVAGAEVEVAVQVAVAEAGDVGVTVAITVERANVTVTVTVAVARAGSESCRGDQAKSESSYEELFHLNKSLRTLLPVIAIPSARLLEYFAFLAPLKASQTHYTDSLCRRLIHGICSFGLSVRTSTQTGLWRGIQVTLLEFAYS